MIVKLRTTVVVAAALAVMLAACGGAHTVTSTVTSSARATSSSTTTPQPAATTTCPSGETPYQGSCYSCPAGYKLTTNGTASCQPTLQAPCPNGGGYRTANDPSQCCPDPGMTAANGYCYGGTTTTTTTTTPSTTPEGKGTYGASICPAGLTDVISIAQGYENVGGSGNAADGYCAQPGTPDTPVCVPVGGVAIPNIPWCRK